MRIRRRIFGWLIGITAFLLVLLIISAVFAPKLIKLESVKGAIVQQLAAEISGRVDFRQIELSWLPRPHATVHNITFSLSEAVNGEITALRVYPKFLPLLWGSVELAKLRVIDSEYNIRIPESPPRDPATQRDFAFSMLLTDFQNLLYEFPEFTLSGLNIKIRNGTVNLLQGDRRVFGFHDLEAAYSRKATKTNFDLTCKSTLWNDISVSGWLDTDKFTSRGNIRFADFRPHAFSDFFFPDSAVKISETLANLVINFELKGTDWLQAEMQGSVPHLKITNKDRALVIKDILIDSSLKLTDKDATISLDKLTMRNPRIILAGEMKYDPEESLVSINLEGQDFDLKSIRKSALKLGGGSDTLEIVFNVLRSGQVPKISLNTKGQRLQDLAVFDNMVIRGEILDGNIFIPGVDLDLKRVAGTVVILDSMLQGYDLKAQMGGSLGKNGKLKLGLNENISPFELDLQIHADLSQLPPILKRVVKYDPFLKELELIRSVKGEALGKLILSNHAKSMRVRVETSEAQFNADYARFPYRLNFEGGRFLYDGQQVNLDNFDVQAGKSTFSINSANLKWQQTIRFQLNSHAATLAMDELYSWMDSAGFIQGGLKEIKATNGFIHLDQTDVSGPLMTPRAWKIRSSGKFDHLNLQSTAVSTPVEIIQGQFGCQDTRLILTNLEATVGKSSFSQITGGLDWGTADRLAVASESTIINVDEFYSWLVKHFGTDEDLKKWPPIRGKLAFQSLTLKGPLSRFNGRQFSASGRFNPSIFDSSLFLAPIRIDRGNFNWQGKHLSITNCNGSAGKSTYSHLSVTLDWGKAGLLTVGSKSMTLFAGEIWPWLSTLQNADSRLDDISITRGNAVLHDVRFSLPLGQVDQWRISATGDLHDITARADFLGPSINLKSGKFILVERNLADIAHNCIKLGSTRLSWGESQITVIGDIYFSPQNMLVDLTISLDSVDWLRLEKIVSFAQGREDKPQKPSQTVVTADLRINAEKFNYKDYVFQPLKASMTVEPAETMIAIEKADLCDISINGFIKTTGQSIEYYLVPSARGKTLDNTLACLSREKASASGTFNLSGEVMANAKTNAKTRIYSGALDFNAKEGRIYQLGLLAKIFAILNLTEIYRGEVPDLVGDGFAYDTMTIKANFEGKKLVMKECTIDGASMGLACDGEIDLAEQKINLVILVAPFKTVDRIVKKIPLLNTVLGGKLVSIPFRAKGDLADPMVIPLSPTAVGSGVLGVMERTLKLPITIIQPLMPDEEGNRGENVQEHEVKPEPQ
jgi:hypothetical protein